MEYIAYSASAFKRSPYFERLPMEYREEFDTVTRVLHFKVNNHVLDNLINWQDFANDPMTKLVFPTNAMMRPQDYQQMRNLIATDSTSSIINAASTHAREELYPKGGEDYYQGIKSEGIYHLFPKTLELFPSKSSTCHSYCTYCHRWMPLVDTEARFVYSNHKAVEEYLDNHTEIEEVIFSGGDPLIMSTDNIIKAVEPLLGRSQIKIIRFITKSLAWWPYRFTSDGDSKNLLRFLTSLAQKNIHVTFLAHFSHPRELEPEIVKHAIQNILATGTIIRSQGPIAKNINDDPHVLAELWSKQIQLGIVPYYQFIDFNYGPISYYKIPIARALDISQKALSICSSLAKTINTPVISDKLMKVSVEGVTTITGERYFVLKCLNSIHPHHIGKIFFEKYCDNATRLSLDGIYDSPIQENINAQKEGVN